MPEPTKFATVLIDPPTDIQQAGARGAHQHYDLLTMDQLKALPVGELAATDAHLWLWSTNAALEASYGLIRAWGFTPRSILTWTKPRVGLGHYLRNSTEQLLLATRGHAPVRFRGQPTWSFAPMQDHSHKPEEQFAIIERVSAGPYLELFARRRPPTDADWSVWGNEIDSDISLNDYGFPVPSDFTDDLPDKGGHQ